VPRYTKTTYQRLLAKVGSLYYEKGLTQQEISDQLQLSRPKVSRLLREAQNSGLVQITVRSPLGIYTNLESLLEQRFGLKEAVIVPASPEETPEAVAHKLGVAGAQYLNRVLRAGDVVGVSWGTTLNAMANALSPAGKIDVHVVQMIGGLGAPEAEVHATDICRRFAHALGCKLTLLAAPGIVDSEETRCTLLTDSHVHQAMSLFEKITVAFVGIGVPFPSSVLMRDGSIMSWEELGQLRQLGAVGDICLRFFDANGQLILSALNERVVGITLEQLQRVERVVGIAGSLLKFEAVRATLRGHLIDVLITDEGLANQLLNENEVSPT
jgi:DNA-binding transcriptional regulator LsrR (DeoR family)